MKKKMKYYVAKNLIDRFDKEKKPKTPKKEVVHLGSYFQPSNLENPNPIIVNSQGIPLQPSIEPVQPNLQLNNPGNTTLASNPSLVSIQRTWMDRGIFCLIYSD